MTTSPKETPPACRPKVVLLRAFTPRRSACCAKVATSTLKPRQGLARRRIAAALRARMVGIRRTATATVLNMPRTWKPWLLFASAPTRSTCRPPASTSRVQCPVLQYAQRNWCWPDHHADARYRKNAIPAARLDQAQRTRTGAADHRHRGLWRIGTQIGCWPNNWACAWCSTTSAKLALGNARQTAHLDNLLALADVISLRAPKPPQTQRPSARDRHETSSHLINASRGTVVDSG